MHRVRSGTLRAGLALAAALAAPHARAASLPDSAAADSAVRVVRQLEETVVRASRLDAFTSQTRLRLTRQALGRLPVDGLAQALALQPGVVLVDGEVVHVRGARPGELLVELDGIALNEPLRDRAPEVPFVALDEVELVTGGLESDHGGGLAGTLVLRTAAAGATWRGRAEWQSDARTGTHYDRGGARISGPLGVGGLGLALSGEARLDDTHLPNLRTLERTRVLGGSFGWRADNRLAALARLSPVADPRRFSIQSLVSRRVDRPYDPMFALRGWTTPCPDDSCLEGPAFSETRVDSGRFAPYDAADHYGVTETSRLAVIASAQRSAGRDRFSVALGWSGERRVTSLDGTESEAYLAKANLPTFGLEASASSDPFHVYLGDSPYFRRERSSSLEARAEWWRETSPGGHLRAGLGITHERAELRELDLTTWATGWDSLRTYDASAPGAYGFVGTRWVREGLVVNAGVRAEWFTPGTAARSTPYAPNAGGTWSWSPRLGLSFPLSPRDAFSVGYARIVQSPGRDYLYDSRATKINNRRPLGNPALQPATAITYEASLRHLIDARWSARASLFYRDLYRQVSARVFRWRTAPGLPQPADYELRYASDDAGRAAGFELAFARENPGHSGVTAAYAWMQTEGSESFEDGLPFFPLTLPQPPPIAEHPLAWDQEHRVTLAAWWTARHGSLSWSTVLGSGLPWTPAERRTVETDLSRIHSRRLPWSESSDFGARWNLPRWRAPLTLGLDVRNVFDHRGARRVSIDGYPNRVINTSYDDYAAFREETGRGGGAYWNDANGWVRVHDPRLEIPPRTVRISVSTGW